MRSVGLVFGNDYSDTPEALNGGVNDARGIERLLKEKLLFEDVSVYTEVTGTQLTRLVLQAARQTHLQHVVNLWIHFSGHATQVRSNNQHESDGMDECVVPTDHRRVGYLRDNFFRDAIRSVNPRTNVIFTFDCCHSATLADLKFCYTKSLFQDPVVTHSRLACEARAICVSGCRDPEKSKETEGQGVMTRCLLEIMEREGVYISLRTLIDDLRVAVQRINPNQYPVLSSSHRLQEHDLLLRLVA